VLRQGGDRRDHHDVVAARIEPKNAAAAASVARAMVAVLQHGEVEERLRKLEEQSA
jgi:hypothetical protein